LGHAFGQPVAERGEIDWLTRHHIDLDLLHPVFRRYSDGGGLCHRGMVQHVALHLERRDVLAL
jgi:hypothetical protein